MEIFSYHRFLTKSDFRDLAIQTKCDSLVVEPNSTPARDILVAEIKFAIDINKLNFSEIEHTPYLSRNSTINEVCVNKSTKPNRCKVC